MSRYLDKDKLREVSDNSRGQADLSRPSTLKAFLRAPEKGLGLWLGSMAMYLLYLLSATLNEFYHGPHKHISNIYTRGAQGFHTLNPLELGGNSFTEHDFLLYLIVCGLFVTISVLWTKLVWFNYDPGIIDTRDQNFDEVGTQRFTVPFICAVLDLKFILSAYIFFGVAFFFLPLSYSIFSQYNLCR